MHWDLGIYPQYDSVKVHGCNELSYKMVLYLKKQGINVSVSGDLWKKFDSLQDIAEISNESLDYKTLDIYGEGIRPKDGRLELRQSVSPEFECIDKIYEANILEGIIQDTEGKIEDILKTWKGKSIAILGTDEFALNAYDFLVAYELDICCFISNDCGQEIFGKKVLERADAVKIWDDIIFIQADKKYSAWGFGEVNMYHYLGYMRNKRFFMLQDYVKLPKTGLKSVLKHWVGYLSRRLVLTGDFLLCLAMGQALEAYVRQFSGIVYCDILEEREDYLEKAEIRQICRTEIRKEDFCMLLLPRHYGCYLDKERSVLYRKELKQKYEEAIKACGMLNFIDYPYENVDWLRPEKISNEYVRVEFRPKRIIIGAINYFSGNVLFREILEEHPEVLQLKDSVLSWGLYSLCVRLAMKPSDKILPLFWKLFEEVEIYNRYGEYVFTDKNAFNLNMEKLLSKKERVTSQEMFVIIHIAYAEMMGVKVKNISDMTIYWEPHSVGRNEVEGYATWLREISEGYTVNIVRNSACFKLS